jgi:photosystem II stability/assembly factor-like uncharacterized protein
MLLLCAGPIAAGIDFLQTPAFMSERAAQGLLLDIVEAGERLVAVGERGHIVYSEDAGRTWLQADVPVYVTLTAVYFASPSTGWAVGHDGVILATRDGGASWHVQLDGYAINRMVLAQAEAGVVAAEQALAAAADAERRGQAEIDLDDARFTLDLAREDAQAGPAKPLLDAWFASEAEGFVLGSYGILLHTVDGGANWRLLSDRLPNPEGFHLNAITRTGAGRLMIAGEAGSLFRSHDRGQTWTRLESPYEGSFFGLLSHGDSVFVFGLRGHLYRSDDQGETWIRIDIAAPLALTGGMVGSEGGITLVGSAGAVAHSSDSGRTFELAIRDDLRAMSAVAEVAAGRLVAVGVGGVRRMDGRGSDLAAEH